MHQAGKDAQRAGIGDPERWLTLRWPSLVTWCDPAGGMTVAGNGRRIAEARQSTLGLEHPGV